MKTLGIIPARRGSKRLPGKNLRPLGGKPLVVRAIEAALSSRRLDYIAVSTDDERVLELATDYDSVHPLRRPQAIATDDSPAIEYVRHAIRTLEAEATETPFQIIVIVQPSSPFTRGSDIDATIELLQSQIGEADSAVSVVRLQHAIHPLKLKILDGDRLLPYIEDETGRFAEHQLSAVYVRNGSVYAATRKTIESGRVIGDDCRGYEMPGERSIDINDETDLRFAEFLLTGSE